MAKAKFSLDFEGFSMLSRQLDEMGGEYLKKATENALVKSAEYCNRMVQEAMDSSPYSFNKGERYSHGRARESAKEVEAMPIKWEGSVAYTYVGVSWKEAPEATYLAYGTPNLKPDNKLRNAMKVKGGVAKEKSRIQQEEFIKVMIEANKHG